MTFAGFIDTATRGRIRITNPPDFIGRAGLNIRGKSSRNFAKKQYHLETLDEFDGDKDVSILGFPAESDWVLQAPYSDKSLMRNFLAYKWSNDIGRYAVHTRFIELFLNTGGFFERASEAWGLGDALPAPAEGVYTVLLPADFDGDGRRDLFVGAEHAAPLLLRNAGDHFEAVRTSGCQPVSSI